VAIVQPYDKQLFHLSLNKSLIIWYFLRICLMFHSEYYVKLTKEQSSYNQQTSHFLSVYVTLMQH